jgi:transposase
MREAVCSGCRERDLLIAALQQQVVALETRVHELEQRLNQNASNSSLPPSHNPPQAPKPVVKKPTGRPRGGQLDHPGPLRRRLPPERLKAVIALIPSHCQRCQAPLPAQAGPDDPEPTWQQVAELPAQLVEVTEYQGHGRRCSCCGEVTWEPLPAEVRAHTQGPRLTAAMAYLSGRHHVSKRGLVEIATDLFGVPLGLGTVSNLEQQMSQALAHAHVEIQQAVQEAPVKHVDETGWKRGGQPVWLWAAATATLACFVIYPSRGLAGLTALLGKVIRGIVCSDRWSAYARLVIRRRQLCWAHLKRDFQKCVDRGGAAQVVGQAGLSAVAAVFKTWHSFREGGLDRAGLQARLPAIRQDLRRALVEGSKGADKKVARFCRNLLRLYPALWTYARVPGVEPTNNHAERVLRRGVLWRKNSFGCQSEAGCRFVERMLTVVQTLRLQQRPVLDYLHQALVAQRAAIPAPNLLPSG